MEDLRQNPAFQQMSLEKQQMMELLIGSLQGKSLTEALPVVMNWNQQMQQKNISFTAEENAILTAILSSQMTPAQKKQYEVLMNMMNKRKR